MAVALQQPFFILRIATVAQLVAQRIRNAWVAGSSPASGLTEKTLCPQGFFFLFARHGRALTGESPEHA